MFPLWDLVIAPILEAAEPKRIVEIGALRGETTVQLLEKLDPSSELHVIDPVPMFDPSDHERRFPGRYIFHRDISHNVLPTLPAVDVALIDGDHNWYTVYHELRLLAEGSRRDGAALPVLIMHDVGWPYGRRDLYYTPELIPEEFRHPYAQRGIRRGRSALVPGGGGFNPTLCNALHEGGPRNGVMTALDDFMAEHDRPLRRLVIPIYFSLAIVVEEDRLEREPRLAAAVNDLNRPRTLRDLLKLAESLRLKEAQWSQNVFYGSEDRMRRGARRYLDLLKATVLAEGSRGAVDRLEQLLDTVRNEAVQGDVVAIGTGCDEAAFMTAYLDAHEVPAAAVHLAAGDGEPLPLLERAGLGAGRLQLIADANGVESERIALLHLAVAGDEQERLLDRLYDRVTVGGYVVLPEASAEGLERFRERFGLGDPVQDGEKGTFVLRKTRAVDGAVEVA